MKHARVQVDGMVVNATERDGQVVLEDGRRLWQDQVTWLPPLAPVERPRTILALGLNYADHAKELAFKEPPKEPLVFLKGERALNGHRQTTKRPADVQFMHYECELAIVIGRKAKKVSREDAYGFIAGYTVANDYAIRDYLENWYRPNLRVKSRDGATAIGPWLVDAADLEAPPERALRTSVNGKQTQSGNTRDLVFDIPFLIEYLSAFMTLAPGDVILTGTPEGVVDVAVGDEVVCEIDGLGRLVNRIAGDAEFGRPSGSAVKEEAR
jgi:5-oxopent-3-ene-1,2,5-tricarboxylate decarboxylase / 2-hydroxyhepta-2,4-diene-1,7-dioate isomerase